MNMRFSFKTLFLLVLAFGCLASGWAASLEHGKVRARARGWHSNEDKSATREPELKQVEEVTREPVVDDEPEQREIVEETVEAQATPDVTRSESPDRSDRVSRRRGKLILIGSQKKKGPSIADGYLAVGTAPVLRFSDVDPVNARPPSPALPEFNFVSSEYVPYLIEEALPEDALNDSSMLSELVIEMEPHTVVSGAIDTRRHKNEEQVEDFHLEEQKSTILRPEEILIFFETDTNMGKTGAVIPFSPATPNTTIKSEATLNKE